LYNIFDVASLANTDKNFYQLSSAEINALLSQLRKDCPDFENRLRAIILNRLDTPHNLKPISDDNDFWRCCCKNKASFPPKKTNRINHTNPKST